MALVLIPAGAAGASQDRPDDAGRSRRDDAARIRLLREVRSLKKRRAEVRRAMEKGRLDRALGQLSAVRPRFEALKRAEFSAERAAWWLLEAELQLRRNDYAAAGLAAMKLVVFDPKSGRAGEALYLTGQAYEGLKRPRKAIELYQECLATENIDDGLRRKAEERVRALQRPPTTQP